MEDIPQQIPKIILLADPLRRHLLLEVSGTQGIHLEGIRLATNLAPGNCMYTDQVKNNDPFPQGGFSISRAKAFAQR
jgi:hypothetical protein